MVDRGIVAMTGVTAAGALLLVLVLAVTLYVLIVWRRRTERAHRAHAEARGWTVQPTEVADLPRLASVGTAHRPVVRFGAEVDGTPVDLIHLSVASVSGHGTDVFVAVATVDEGLPGVSIEPVGRIEKLVSAAGVRREMELGDPWFDRSFELFPHRGGGPVDQELIRTEVLTPGVQAALRGTEDISLDIGGGRVIARSTGDGRAPADVHRRLDEVAAVAAAVASSLVETATDRAARGRSAAGVGSADARIVTVDVDPRQRPDPVRRTLRSAAAT